MRSLKKCLECRDVSSHHTKCILQDRTLIFQLGDDALHREDI